MGSSAPGINLNHSWTRYVNAQPALRMGVLLFGDSHRSMGVWGRRCSKLSPLMVNQYAYGDINYEENPLK